MLLSIPSPHSGTIGVGPLVIHMYGLMLLAGIAACIWLTGRALGRARRRLGSRLPRRGLGRRLRDRRRAPLPRRHVAGTRCRRSTTGGRRSPSGSGGLGVWGGILFGCLAGAVIVKRSGNSVFRFMDACAPGLLLAQGIGRIGNWWNQELFGKPTTLPWGLRDRPSPPSGGLSAGHDVPSDVPLRADLRPRDGRRAAAARPALPLQAAGAVRAVRQPSTVRPLLRGAAADRPAHEFAGLRLNAWVSIVCSCASTAFFVWWQFFHAGRTSRPRPASVPVRGPKMAIPRGRR